MRKSPDVMTSLWPGNLWSAEAEAGPSQLRRGWREKQTYGDTDTERGRHLLLCTGLKPAVVSSCDHQQIQT